MSKTLWLNPIAISVGALLCVLGATWLDVLAQHRSNRSAWDAVAPPPRPIRVETSDGATSISIPGTSLNKETIQDDLCTAFNNALPLQLFNIAPLNVPYYSSQSPALSTYVVVIIWWIATLAILALPLRVRSTIRYRLVRYGHYALTATGLGFLGGYALLEFVPSLSPAVSGFLLALYAVAVFLFFVAPLLVVTHLLYQTNANRRDDGIDPSLQALLTAEFCLVSFAVVTVAALWLGWYTNDTRVNILEPTPTIILYAATVLTTTLTIHNWLLMNSRPAAWRLTAALGVSAVCLAVLPAPPRLSNTVNDLVLLNDNTIVQYAEPRKVIPEQSQVLHPNVQPYIQGIATSFNGANPFTHIPVSLSWSRPAAMLVALAALSACLVFGALSMWWLLQSIFALAVPPREGLIKRVVAVACTVVVVLGTFAYLTLWIKRGVASHSIERMLLLSPPKYSDEALRVLASYYTDPDAIPAAPREYARTVSEFSERIFAMMADCAVLRNQYYGRGGGDWVDATSNIELVTKRRLLEASAALIQQQRADVRKFPSVCRRRLIDNGAPMEIGAASEQNWVRWLNNRMVVLDAEEKELLLHKQYIDALLATPPTSMIHFVSGAVTLSTTAAVPANEYVVLKIRALEATLHLEELRAQQELMFLTAGAQKAVRSASSESLVATVKAMTELLSCFSDAAAFALRRNGEGIEWVDQQTGLKCELAAERVRRAQRGIL